MSLEKELEEKEDKIKMLKNTKNNAKQEVERLNSMIDDINTSKLLNDESFNFDNSILGDRMLNNSFGKGMGNDF